MDLQPLDNCPYDRPVLLVLESEDGTQLEQTCLYDRREPFPEKHPITGLPYTFKPIGWKELHVRHPQ